jgi:hypothetical protein
MARAKKTIKIYEIVTIANKILRESTCDSMVRTGVSALLCDILHETNNYNGFSFLRAHELACGIKPGIVFDPSPKHNHSYPDDTRRRYTCRSND